MIARTMLAALAAAGVAAALPGAADAQATATQHCSYVAARQPGGQPPSVAIVTVIDANGVLRTVRAVPGPCTAPGFAKGA